ncbi:MAG: hypothetical protein H6696_04410 [Deferribacteres bacterium]|nr:hypothetical protein [Deferribacteres bacterium]
MNKKSLFSGFLGMYCSDGSRTLPNFNNLRPVYYNKGFAFFQTGERSNSFSVLNDNIFLFIHGGRDDTIKNILQDQAKNQSPITEKIKGKKDFIFFQLRNNRSLLEIHTDRFGRRSIFYMQYKGIIYFAPSIQQLFMVLPPSQRKISKEALYFSYHFRSTPTDQSLIESIKKIPAGYLLRCSDEKMEIQQYFDLVSLYKPEKFKNTKETELTNFINKALANEINRSINNSQNVGIALSGGVDSGLIAVHLALQKIPFKAYTFLYEEDYNELHRIERLSNNIDLNLTKIILDASTVLKCFSDANETGSEPVSFNASLLQKMISFCKQDGIQTFFDGDGADRLFFGMNAHLRYLKMGLLYQILSKVGLNKHAGKMLQKSKSGQWKQLGNLFENWSIGIKPYPERHYDINKAYDSRYEIDIFNKYILQYWKPFQDDFRSDDIRLYFAFQSIQMCPELFFYSAHEQFSQSGIENFSPFWNDNIVQLSLSIPQYWKTKQWRTKYILRKAGAQYFDPQYWIMPKIGLQNSLTYLVSDKIGRDWFREKCIAIEKTNEFNWLKEQGVAPKAERLIPFFEWKSSKKLEF